MRTYYSNPLIPFFRHSPKLLLILATVVSFPVFMACGVITGALDYYTAWIRAIGDVVYLPLPAKCSNENIL